MVVAAWVGGHAALGAFAARILFRDLPRSVAASTMTTVFREFDGLVAVAITLLLLAMLLRLLLRRTIAWRGSDWIATAAATALSLVGIIELTLVHPAIEQAFRAGDTLSPHFIALHRASERLGHIELLLMLLLFTSVAVRQSKDVQVGPPGHDRPLGV